MARTLNLLPGWGFHATVWEALLPFLAGDWEPHPVELPWSEPPLTWLEPEGPLAARLRPGWCLGWSLGGTLALTLAAQARIEGVVLLASTPCWRRGAGWGAGLEAQQIGELRGQMEDDPLAALRQFTALVALGSRQPARIRSALQHHLLGADRAPELTAALDLLLTLDARVPPAPVRVAVIAGGGDRLLREPPPGTWLAPMNAGDCVVLPETGHAPLLSNPRSVADALRRLTDAEASNTPCA